MWCASLTCGPRCANETAQCPILISAYIGTRVARVGTSSTAPAPAHSSPAADTLACLADCGCSVGRKTRCAAPFDCTRAILYPISIQHAPSAAREEQTMRAAQVEVAFGGGSAGAWFLGCSAARLLGSSIPCFFVERQNGGTIFAKSSNKVSLAAE